MNVEEQLKNIEEKLDCLINLTLTEATQKVNVNECSDQTVFSWYNDCKSFLPLSHKSNFPIE